MEMIIDSCDEDGANPQEKLEARLEELWMMTNTLREQIEQRDTEHIVSLQHTINLLMEENVALTEDAKTLRTQLWMAQKRIDELEQQHGIAQEKEQDEQNVVQVDGDCRTWFLDDGTRTDTIKLINEETQTTPEDFEITVKVEQDLASSTKKKKEKFRSLTLIIESATPEGVVCCEPCVEKPDQHLPPKQPSVLFDPVVEELFENGVIIKQLDKSSRVQYDRTDTQEWDGEVPDKARDRDRDRTLHTLLDVVGSLEGEGDGGIQPWGQMQPSADIAKGNASSYADVRSFQTRHRPQGVNAGSRASEGIRVVQPSRMRHSATALSSAGRAQANQARLKARRYSLGGTTPVTSAGTRAPKICIDSTMLQPENPFNQSPPSPVHLSAMREGQNMVQGVVGTAGSQHITDSVVHVHRSAGGSRQGERLYQPNHAAHVSESSHHAQYQRGRGVRAPPCADSPSMRATGSPSPSPVEDRSQVQRYSIPLMGPRRQLRAQSHGALTSAWYGSTHAPAPPTHSKPMILAAGNALSARVPTAHAPFNANRKSQTPSPTFGLRRHRLHDSPDGHGTELQKASGATVPSPPSPSKRVAPKSSPSKSPLFSATPPPRHISLVAASSRSSQRSPSPPRPEKGVSSDNSPKHVPSPARISASRAPLTMLDQIELAFSQLLASAAAPRQLGQRSSKAPDAT